MKLAIVGSTFFVDPYGDQLAEWIVRSAIELLEPSLVISGGAKGVDTMAWWISKELERPCTVFLPAVQEWDPPGSRVGFKARNLRIAQRCDALLRVTCRESTTYGSGWTADRAEELGKPVWRWVV